MQLLAFKIIDAHPLSVPLFLCLPIRYLKFMLRLCEFSVQLLQRSNTPLLDRALLLLLYRRIFLFYIIPRSTPGICGVRFQTLVFLIVIERTIIDELLVHAYDCSNRSIVALLFIFCTLFICYYYALESGVLYRVISL